MLLHEMTAAPNPRRVRIFLAEKGLEVATRQVDMMAGEHRSPAFLEKSPSGKIPVLELDDGTCIAESVAICRYFEALHPEPNLFGEPPVELALVEMHNRIIELELLSQVGRAWVNSETLAQMMPGMFTPNPAIRADAEQAIGAFYARLDRALADKPFIAGDRYTIADITAQVTVDFSSGPVDVPPGDRLSNLERWRSEMAARPSAGA